MLKINFSLSGNTQDKQIAPLLLLPFVENAFKHGVSKVRKEPYVKIRIEFLENVLNFRVENSIPKVPESNGNDGLGINNVKRRLALTYPGRSEMVCKALKDSYLVTMQIILDHES